MEVRRLSSAGEMTEEGVRNEWKKETWRILKSRILKRPLKRTNGLLERTTLWMRPLKRAKGPCERPPLWITSAQADMEPLERT